MTIACQVKTHLITSPVGRLHLVASEAGLCRISFAAATRAADEFPEFASAGDVLAFALPQLEAVLGQTERELAEYFAGKRREFDVPLDLRGTPFQVSVWRASQQVSYGSTISYRALAAAAGRPAAIRAAGAANGANPLPVIIPCHRIVGSNGSLTGYGGGIANKRFLLDLERGVRSRAKYVLVNSSPP